MSFTSGTEDEVLSLFFNATNADIGGKWSNINDLDGFFRDVYKYYQVKGFRYLLLEKFLELIKILFVALLSFILSSCVNYNALVSNDSLQWNVLVNFDNINSRLNYYSIVLLVTSGVFFCFRLAKAVTKLQRIYDISFFYKEVLDINTSDLQNYKWEEIQSKLVEAQRLHKMCIYKPEINELDIYQRILRKTNYLIGLFNQGILNYRINIPCYGRCSYLSEALKFNIKLIFFHGRNSFFQNNFRLRNDLRNPSMIDRANVTNMFKNRILVFAFVNFALSPFIFIYQTTYFFFKYTEILKRTPTIFASHIWSNICYMQLRHYNELDHEFQQRLNAAYKPTKSYIAQFNSHFLAILFRYLQFFSGSILSAVIGISLLSPNFYDLPYIVTIVAALGLIVSSSSSFIPDENETHEPEYYFTSAMRHLHYLSIDWKEKAHTMKVQNVMNSFFTHKFVFIISEVLSPILTPYSLLFHVYPRATNIVEFFIRCSSDVPGIGDACSFAQMRLDEQGTSNEEFSVTKIKIQMSLVRFSMKNPQCKLHAAEFEFVEKIKEEASKNKLYADAPIKTMKNSVSREGMDNVETRNTLKWISSETLIADAMETLFLDQRRNSYDRTFNDIDNHISEIIDTNSYGDEELKEIKTS